MTNAASIISFPASLLPSVLQAQGPYGPEWGMHPMWWMWGAWGIGMMLIMGLFWAAIIVVIVLAIRWLLRQGREQRPDAALDILRQRYARGELNRDEFERMKKELLP